MADRYVVTGAYVTLKTRGVYGAQVVGFYKGALVPADVPQESIEHHLSRGLIAKVEDAPAEVTPVADDDAEAGAPARRARK